MPNRERPIIIEMNSLPFAVALVVGREIEGGAKVSKTEGKDNQWIVIVKSEFREQAKEILKSLGNCTILPDSENVYLADLLST